MTTAPTCEQHDLARLDDGRWACTACPLVVPACTHCPRPLHDTALLVCDRCVERGRRLVLDIAEDLERFPYTVLEAAGLRSARYDLVRTTTADDDARLPFGLDAVTPDPHGGIATLVKRPETAVDILAGWAELWAETRGDSLDDTVRRDGWASYLAAHTVWAMQNPDASDWTTYADEARIVRSTVRRILGITPVREGTPCPDCGADTVRDWQPRADHTPTHEHDHVTRRHGLTLEGLADTVRCTRCHRSWDTPTDLHLAALAALPSMPAVRPWALVTFAQLALALEGRVPRGTLKSWIFRGQLRPVQGPWPRSETRVRMRRDGTERLYRLGDAERLCAPSASNARSGQVRE
jgi:hypothetical protein